MFSQKEKTITIFFTSDNLLFSSFTKVLIIFRLIFLYMEVMVQSLAAVV